jgi:hypothetical protein
VPLPSVESISKVPPSLCARVLMLSSPVPSPLSPTFSTSQPPAICNSTFASVQLEWRAALLTVSLKMRKTSA